MEIQNVVVIHESRPVKSKDIKVSEYINKTKSHILQNKYLNKYITKHLQFYLVPLYVVNMQRPDDICRNLFAGRKPKTNISDQNEY